MPTRPRRASRSRRRRVVVACAAGLLVAAVALIVLALPFRDAPGEAREASTDLTAAAEGIQKGNLRAARERVASAREHVDAARGSVHGVGGDVWSLLPVFGSPVDDARNLVDALDHATSVAEVGVELYPEVAGPQATLFRDQQVDLDTLDRVIAGTRDVGGHLLAAREALDEVDGTFPLVGDTIASRRDTAAERVEPLADTYLELEPLLEELPTVFGADGERTYLIAMLNPAELRYSGGAALSFAPMSWDQGKLELGESIVLLDDPRLGERVTWRKVRENPFHRRDSRVANSTFAPSWSVSGEELLRSWRTVRGKRHDGLLAVDVVGLSRLVGASGGLTVPGYGSLTEDNLVETLVGSYDDYYPDATAQDSLSKALIPAFQDKLFGGGDYVDKAQALVAAARERHFATYFRDEEVQEGFAAMGLAGDLAEPEGDYLGVFTQNTNGSKADYWQKRHLDLDVTLDDEGTAANRLEVLVDNDSPPYPFALPDPGRGYFTRWAGMALGVFLPGDARAEQAALDNQGWSQLRDFRDHGFVVNHLLLEPTEQERLRLDYTVPGAATPGEAGELTYRLAVDPQGTVIPASARLRVRLPDGYAAGSLPAGWTSTGGSLTYRTDALDKSQEWQITIRPSN